MSLEIVQLRDGQDEMRFHIDSDGDVAIKYGDDDTLYIPWDEWTEIIRWIDHMRFEFNRPKESS